jgi:hypothetical protein
MIIQRPSALRTALKLLTNPTYHPIVPGDLRAGNAFQEPVRTLAEETILSGQ